MLVVYLNDREVVIVPSVIIQYRTRGSPRKQLASETMTLSEKMTSQATG